jgi:predicted XRE-type DNA-binding protein
MDLSTWIKNQGGPSKVAKILGVEKSTVSQWYRNKCLPKDELKLKIVYVSKGKVTLNSMVKSYAVIMGWKY